MFYIDTHCHIYPGACEDYDVVVNSSKEKNVLKMINAAEDLKTSKEVLRISKLYPNIIYSAIGIHPENIPEDINKSVNELENMLKNNKVTAIGEIGLDYHWTKETKTQQIDLFEKQLSLAEKYNLPVIIHSRDATEDTINILKKHNVKGVIHSFTGSIETANIYIKMGFLLGINGVVTFKNCNLKDILKKIDIKNLIYETDSPFLSPVPFRGTPNSPQNVVLVYKFVAEVLSIPEEELKNIAYENASRYFDI